MSLALLEKARAGDSKSFEKLMIENSEFIYKLAYIHTKYEEDSQIIMKDIVIYIKKNIRKLSKEEDFKKFIIKSTIKFVNEYLEEVGMIEKDESKNYINCDGTINMFEAIDLLETDLKNVAILFYFYHMSCKEIGEILSINESTVKMYLRNSLKIMKERTKGDFLDGKQQNR